MENTQNNYQKVASYEAQNGSFKKCLLLYSGGLDTSVMLKWIQENYQAEVVTLTIDLGQTADNLESIKQKAINLGATKAIVYDAKKIFADKIISKAIAANADYQGGYHLSTPLGRVMISEIAVEIAAQENISVIAHGCTGKGNDQVRFEGYITTLNPEIKMIAPVREWSMGRDQEIEYASKNGIPVEQKIGKPYSYDENLWGNTGEGGEIEDPKLIAPLENILKWSSLVKDAPQEAELVTVDFTKGVPKGLNNTKMELLEIIQTLNKTGGKHGVGVVQLIEDRLVGLKVRGVYENPAASIIITAHKKLEMLVSTREENELKAILDQKWAYLCYAAKWYDPVMSHLSSYFANQNQKVTGQVTLELYKGNITVVALESPNSLFNSNLATFNQNSSFNQNASAGFIEIYSLAMKTAYNLEKNT